MKSLFHKNAFVFMGSSLILGILLAAKFSLHYDSLLWLLVFFIIVACVELVLRLSNFGFLLATQLFFILFGAFIYQNVDPERQQEWFKHYDHEQFKAKVIVNEVGSPDKEWIKVIATVQSVYGVAHAESKPFDLLLFVKASDKIVQKGDVLMVDMAIERIQNKGNPGEFDAESYWRNKGVLYIGFLSEESYKLVDYQAPNFLVRATDAIIAYCRTFFKQNFGRQEGAVLSAIVLGDKSALDAETVNSFLNTGTMHVLAVSGMHFGLLMLMMMAVFERFSRFISKKWALILMLILFWFYALLTGMSASVVRAIFMFSMLVLAQLSNRQYSAMNILFFSAFVLLLLNPLTLFDIGFQLSYLAMIGIYLFYAPIRDFVKVENRWIKWLWEGTAVGLAAQVMTIPISLYYFHQFPNYFLLSNWVLMLSSNFILGMGAGILLVSKFPLLYKPVAFVLGFIVTISLFALSQIEQLPGAVAYGFDLHFAQVLVLFACALVLFSTLHWKGKFAMTSLIVIASLVLISQQRFYSLSKKEVCIFNNSSNVLAIKNGSELLCLYEKSKFLSQEKVQRLMQDYHKVNPGDLRFYQIEKDIVSIKNGALRILVERKQDGMVLNINNKKFSLVNRFRQMNMDEGYCIGREGSMGCDYYLEQGAKLIALE